MAHQVRVQSASGFVEIVTSLGGDATALLQGVGIEADDLKRPHAYVSHRAYLQLLENAAVALNRPDLGLLMLDRQDITVLGPIAIAAHHASTLDDAVECVGRYIRFQGSAWTLRLQQQPRQDQVMVVVELAFKRNNGKRQQMDLAIGFVHKVLKLFSGGMYQPLEAHFPYSRIAPLESYRKRFPCPLRFDSNQAGVLIARSDLGLAVRESNPATSEAALGYLKSLYGEGSPSMSTRVRALIRPLLAVGICHNETVASALALHPRTLHRHLAKEGRRFEEIRDEVRQELARELVSQPRLAFAHIAGSLGYAEQSAFSRSCRRWFGASPRALRAQWTGNGGATGQADSRAAASDSKFPTILPRH